MINEWSGQLHNDNNNIIASNNNIKKWEMIIKAHNEEQLIEKLNHKQNHNNQYIILSHTVNDHGIW